MDEIYVVMYTKECYPISKKVVYGKDLPHDDRGLVKLIDVLDVMGYTIERYKYAVMPSNHPMIRERRYDLDDLRLMRIDLSKGLIE